MTFYDQHCRGLIRLFALGVFSRRANNPGILKPTFERAFDGKTVKWTRDLHLLRERASRSRTETWSRQQIEYLFGVGRATAQTL